jgi:hypothetical protein
VLGRPTRCGGRHRCHKHPSCEHVCAGPQSRVVRWEQRAMRSRPSRRRWPKNEGRAVYVAVRVRVRDRSDDGA